MHLAAFLHTLMGVITLNDQSDSVVHPNQTKCNEQVTLHTVAHDDNGEDEGKGRSTNGPRRN